MMPFHCRLFISFHLRLLGHFGLTDLRFRCALHVARLAHREKRNSRVIKPRIFGHQFIPRITVHSRRTLYVPEWMEHKRVTSLDVNQISSAIDSLKSAVPLPLGHHWPRFNVPISEVGTKIKFNDERSYPLVDSTRVLLI
jgi:hypothetical protein